MKDKTQKTLHGAESFIIGELYKARDENGKVNFEDAVQITQDVLKDTRELCGEKTQENEQEKKTGRKKRKYTKRKKHRKTRKDKGRKWTRKQREEHSKAMRKWHKRRRHQ